MLRPPSCVPSRAGAVLAFGLAVAATAAHAAWGIDPVRVDPTAIGCPQLVACSDGHDGAIVIWEQQLPSGDVLRARHVLAGGDVDPAWPSPAIVCATPGTPVWLRCLSDGAGGAYVQWVFDRAVHLTRLDAAGALASGWPACGKRLNQMPTVELAPVMHSDGSGGVYVEWIDTQAIGLTITSVAVAHFGPDGQPAMGYSPGGIRRFGAVPGPDYSVVCTSAMGTAPDGGLWLAWGTGIVRISDSATLPGDYRLVRLDAEGLPAPGWTEEGSEVGTFPWNRVACVGAYCTSLPGADVVGVTTDGADGAYLLLTEADQEAADPLAWHAMLTRRNADGSMPADWPAAGIVLTSSQGAWLNSIGSDGAMRALPDGHGNVCAAIPELGAPEGLPYLRFLRISRTGDELPGGGLGGFDHLETFVQPNGGTCWATCLPSGAIGDPFHPSQAPRVDAWTSDVRFNVTQGAPGFPCFGDVAIAPTSDNGAIVFWSQVVDRVGIFAVRLGPFGLVTDVEAGGPGAPWRFALHRAADGTLRGAATFDVAGAVRCELFDVTGRLVSRLRLDVTPGSREWTLPDSSPLRAGLYFARLLGGGQNATARVAVAP